MGEWLKTPMHILPIPLGPLKGVVSLQSKNKCSPGKIEGGRGVLNAEH